MQDTTNPEAPRLYPQPLKCDFCGARTWDTDYLGGDENGEAWCGECPLPFSTAAAATVDALKEGIHVINRGEYRIDRMTPAQQDSAERLRRALFTAHEEALHLWGLMRHEE